MTGESIAGLGLVVGAGILAGGSTAPIKGLRRYAYPQWAFVSGLFGLVVLPWLFTLLLCPHALAAFASLPAETVIMANLFSAAWGIANVLAGLCLVRIGFSLTVGLLTGIGLPIGVLVPLVLRGSGLFAYTPPLYSRGGILILSGVVVILVAVVLITLAGFGREAALRGPQLKASSGFAVGLLMATVCGLLQVGLSFAFVYGQGPISAALLEQGAGHSTAGIGVWAVTLPGGALISLGYAAWLLSRSDGWSMLLAAPRDLALSLLIGVLFFLFIAAMGTGMRLMGALGASIGIGIYQMLQVSTAQAVGVACGEWRGVDARSRQLMSVAFALLVTAVLLLAGGKAV